MISWYDLNGSTLYDAKGDKKYPSGFPLTEKDKEWIEQKISSMSLYEKCAQMIMAPVYESYLKSSSPDYDSTMALVKDYKIGGLVMFQGTLKEEIAFINKAQTNSDIPLLISADYENGLGGRIDDALEFPHAMALGATLNSYLSYLEGRAIAEECKLIGINQNFAPVLDINNNSLNPVINIRSFSESKFTVSELSSSFILGTTHGGIIATAKHFPGHGNTELDSHTDIPRINGSIQYLFDNELFPFINAIKNGVQSIMTGHLVVPSLDTLPASISKKIVTGLLQKQLGFDGLIVTDAFNMEAITKMYSQENAIVLAVKAGNDIILMPPYPVEAIKTIFRAVKSGEISEERINTSVRKILSAKRWLKIEKTNSLTTDEIIDSVNNINHQQLANLIAERSITLIKNDAKIIPLDFSKYKNVSCITITDGKGDETSQYIQNILSDRFTDINIQLLNNKSKPAEYKSVLSSINNSDLILLPLFIDVQSQKKNEKVRADQIDFIKKILKLNVPVVVISFKSPYLISSLPGATTFLDTYSYSYSSQNAGLKAILGEIDIRGKLPVSIPNTDFEIGFGIGMQKSKETKIITEIDDDLSRKVDSLVNDFININDAANFNLCVGSNGKIVYQKEFNYSENKYSSNVDTNKVFNLGSLTAPLSITSAVMLLIDDGLISLDDKVSYHLPIFQNTDKQNITIVNLLMHNSGLSSEFDSIGLHWNKEQIINSIVNSKLQYQIGTTTRYGKLNDIVLQYLIEKISGKNLFDFLNDKLFKPLGMKNTIVKGKSNNINMFGDSNFRYGTSITKKEILKNIFSGFTGSDGLYSSIKDLAVFAQMLIQNGYYNGEQYISASAINEITTLKEPVSYTGWQTITSDLIGCDVLSENCFGYYSDNGNYMWIDKGKNVFIILLTDSGIVKSKVIPEKLKCEIEKIIDER